MHRSQLFAQWPDLAHLFRDRFMSNSRIASLPSPRSWKGMTISRWETTDPNGSVRLAIRAKRHLVACWMRHRACASPTRHDMARLLVMACYLIQARKRIARAHAIDTRGPWAALVL